MEDKFDSSQYLQDVQELKKLVGKGLVVVQEEWCSFQALHDYLEDVLPSYKVMSISDILKLDPTNMSALFCDSNILLELLEKSNTNSDTNSDTKTDANSKIDFKSYPEFLKRFLKREISAIKMRDLPKHDCTYFVGPIENDDTFCGQMIHSNDEKISLIESIESIMGRNDFDIKRPVFDKTVYYCREEKENSENVFNNQYRIFVADGELFGIADCTDYLIDEKNRVYQTPPESFLSDILNANEYKYCVIRVALRSDGEWCLVEVNHPLSPVLCVLPIDQYIYYYCKAWKYIVARKTDQ